MKNWIKFFESLDDEVSSKLTEEHKSLKRGLLSLIDIQLGEESSELGKVQNFIDSYLGESETLDEFAENQNIFEFYLKYQSDIDSILEDSKYFDEVPKKNNVYSLYDYIIEGTKIAVTKALETIKKEIFK